MAEKRSWLRALISKDIVVNLVEAIRRRKLHLKSGPGIGLTLSDSEAQDQTIVEIRSTAAVLALSVMDYGAVGDGVTDDTEAIQDALDVVAAAGGGTVALPIGTYLVSATLNINGPNIELRGESGSRINFTSTNTPCISSVSDFKCGCVNIRVEQTGATAVSGNIHFDFSGQLNYVIGCRSSGAYNAIDMTGSTDFEVSGRNLIESPVNKGIVCGAGTSRGEICSNRFDPAAAVKDVEISGTANAIDIHDNWFITPEIGVESANTCGRILVHHNTFLNPVTTAWDVSGSDCLVWGNTGQGIGLKANVVESTISSGSLDATTFNGTAIEVHPESGASDVLHDITGGYRGSPLLTIKPDIGDTIVVLDNSDPSGGNIKLERKQNLVLRQGDYDRLTLEYDGTYWVEVSRALSGRYATISSLANGANANYDFAFDTDGRYSVGIRVVTDSDLVWIGSVIAKRASSTVTLIGTAVATSLGDSTGLTVTVSGSSSNLRINVANATGVAQSGTVEIDDEEMTR